MQYCRDGHKIHDCVALFLPLNAILLPSGQLPARPEQERQAPAGKRPGQQGPGHLHR